MCLNRATRRCEAKNCGRQTLGARSLRVQPGTACMAERWAALRCRYCTDRGGCTGLATQGGTDMRCTHPAWGGERARTADDPLFGSGWGGGRAARAPEASPSCTTAAAHTRRSTAACACGPARGRAPPACAQTASARAAPRPPCLRANRNALATSPRGTCRTPARTRRALHSTGPGRRRSDQRDWWWRGGIEHKSNTNQTTLP